MICGPIPYQLENRGKKDNNYVCGFIDLHSDIIQVYNNEQYIVHPVIYCLVMSTIWPGIFFSPILQAWFLHSVIIYK